VVGYQNSWYDYTGPAATAGQPEYSAVLNRLEHLIILNTRWQIAEQTVGILGYNFGAVGYTSSTSLAPSGSPYASPAVRNDYSHYVYVGVDHSFRSDLSVSARVGAQIVDYYNSDEAPNNPGSDVSPYASLSFNYTYMEGGVFNLGFTHAKNSTDVAFDAATGKLTFDQESSTVSASVTQVLTPLSPDLTATLSGTYQNSAYDGGGFNGDTDDYYTLGFNLTYQITHYISTEAGYNYDLLSSQVGGRGYNRNRVYIGVTASY
jgi:hypothetical protein